MMPRFYVAVCIIVAACGSSFGWVGPTLVQLAGADSEISMTSSQISWMVAIIEVGNLISPIPAGLLADMFGRKLVILCTGPLYIVSWLIILQIKTLAALCVARVIQGLAIGIAFTVVPMYLGEISCQSIRGAITSMFQMAFYSGFLYEYVIGPFVSYDKLVVISMILPTAFLIMFAWQPESPYFYLVLGKHEKAERSLMCLRGTTNKEDVREELSEVKKTVQQEMSNKASWLDIVATPADRRALMISQVVGGIRIMSGLPVIVSYSTQLFERTGFKLVPDFGMTIIMGCILFISCFFSTALTDSVGRKPLLFVSSIGCTISLAIASVYFYCAEKTDFVVSQYTWVCPACIILYNLFIAFGLDPVSMTYRSELFPTHTRALASSLATINFTIGAFITLKLYQVISDSVGVYFAFAIYSLSCFFGTIWMYFYAIETKDKTLTEIQIELSKKS